MATNEQIERLKSVSDAFKEARKNGNVRLVTSEQKDAPTGPGFAIPQARAPSA